MNLMVFDYKLLKDLPNLTAGAIFHYYDNDQYVVKDATSDNVVPTPMFMKLHKTIVENNPEWFEKIDFVDEQVCKCVLSIVCTNGAIHQCSHHHGH